MRRKSECTQRWFLFCTSMSTSVMPYKSPKVIPRKKSRRRSSKRRTSGTRGNTKRHSLRARKSKRGRSSKSYRQQRRYCGASQDRLSDGSVGSVDSVHSYGSQVLDSLERDSVNDLSSQFQVALGALGRSPTTLEMIRGVVSDEKPLEMSAENYVGPENIDGTLYHIYKDSGGRVIGRYLVHVTESVELVVSILRNENEDEENEGDESLMGTHSVVVTGADAHNQELQIDDIDSTTFSEGGDYRYTLKFIVMVPPIHTLKKYSRPVYDEELQQIISWNTDDQALIRDTIKSMNRQIVRVVTQNIFTN